MVKIGKGGKELLGPSHLVTDDDPPLPALLDLEEFDHGSAPLPDLIHDVLVNLERLVRGLFEERPVRDGLDVDGFVGIERGRVGFGKDASLQKVASELLTRGRRDGSGRSVSLESVSLFNGRVVEVVFVDPIGADTVLATRLSTRSGGTAHFFSTSAPGPSTALIPG